MATSVTLKPNAIDISGSTSGTTTLQASAVAGTTTLTLPAATDTLVGKATTDTLTNKTLTGAAMNGTLGATTPSTASVTTLTTSSTVTHSGGTANGVAYLNGSKVLTTGSALVFDGTALGVGSASAGPRIQARGAINNDALISSLRTDSGVETAMGSDGGLTAGFIRTVSNHPLVFGTNNTERARIDSSGNLGVGTTSPNKAGIGKAISISSSSYALFEANYSDARAGYLFAASNGTFVGEYRSQPLVFTTADTERARIDSSGNLLVGTTSGSDRLDVRNSTNRIGNFQYTSGTFGDIVFKDSGGTTRGYIEWTSGGTTYSTSSDYRLKENVQPMTGALEKVAQLNPCTYTWKETGKSGQGFIAHELQTVVPEAVVGEKDAVDEEGNPKYQGIDTSFLVATLTAAIQEQQAIIQSLTARITALESA